MQGVRVLEVADYVFVPAAGAVLSNWGADVIKVEHHEQGDLMRGLWTFHPAGGEPRAVNPVMESANRGKRSIGINLGSPDGLELLYELVRTADVFLTSKLVETRRKLRIDVDDIRSQNPNIIYVRGTGHGVRGPEAAKGGFDSLSFWYRSGIGRAAQAPELSYVPNMPAPAFGDLTGAMNIAGGISAALFHRERTGEASTVEVSLLGSGMWSLSGGVSLSAMYDVPALQRESRVIINPLIRNYRTKDDRWIAICCLQASRYWPDLCRALGRADLAADERFSTAEGLQTHAGEVVKLLEEEFASRTETDWHAKLDDFQGQWAPVQDPLSVVSDRQAAANGYTMPTKSSDGSEDLLVVQPPVQFNEQPVSTAPAPGFNEHGDEILAELGYDPDRILDLKLNSAIT